MFYSRVILLLSPLVFKHTVSTECPTNSSQWQNAESATACTAPTEYHCLSDENGGKVEVCLDKSWVQPGFCPEFNTVAQKMDVSLCQESRGVCPKSNFWSNEVYQYPACLPKYVAQTTVSVSTRTQSIVTTNSVSRDSNPASSDKQTEGSNLSGGIIALIVISFVVATVAMVLAVCYGVRRHRRRRRKKKPRDTRLSTDEPLMPDPEKKAKPNEDEVHTKDQTDSSGIETTDNHINEDKMKPAAVYTSEGKKMSVDGDFTYPIDYENTTEAARSASSLLKKTGILILISGNKKAMSDVAKKVALTCDKSEDESGFEQFKKTFEVKEIYKGNENVCVVFDGCFKDEKGKSLNLHALINIFKWMHEQFQLSDSKLSYIITVPESLYNGRKGSLKGTGLFADDYVFKFKITKEEVLTKITSGV